MKLMKIQAKYRTLLINPEQITVISTGSSLNPDFDPFISIGTHSFELTPEQHEKLLRDFENAAND